MTEKKRRQTTATFTIMIIIITVSNEKSNSSNASKPISLHRCFFFTYCFSSVLYRRANEKKAIS